MILWVVLMMGCEDKESTVVDSGSVVEDTEERTTGNGSERDRDTEAVGAGDDTQDTGVCDPIGLQSDSFMECMVEVKSKFMPEYRTSTLQFLKVSYRCGITTGNELVCWENGKVTFREAGYVDVAFGAGYQCAITTGGHVECWGGEPFGLQYHPEEAGYVAVASGSYHSCALSEDGRVDCWGVESGDLDYGQVGDVPEDVVFVEVSAGSRHNCALDECGRIHCWGDGDSGQTEAPAGEFVQVESAGEYSCGVRTDGEVVCWGLVLKPGGSGEYFSQPECSFVEIGLGTYHACGIDIEGQLSCWRFNQEGEANPPDGEFVEVGGGSHSTCAINSEDYLVCWGDNDNGQTTPP